MTAGFVVLNLAYLALLASTMTRTIVWLRSALVSAAIFFVFFGAIEHLSSMIFWNVLIGGMHLLRLTRDLAAKRAVTLSPEERATRDELFAELSDFEFHALWQMGSERTYGHGDMVVSRGDLPDTVALILDGFAHVRRQNEVVRGLRRGALIGEMSFVSASPASVDVVAAGVLRVRSWPQQTLVTLDQLHPPAARAFRDYVASNLAAKARL